MHHLYDPKAPDRESIVNSEQAGLLTCNSFCHPSRLHSGSTRTKTFGVLLTVARQFVILTRFPINLLYVKPFPFDEGC